nr:V-type ATPase subunit [Candidatus Sigynarchaeota archaeon]
MATSQLFDDYAYVSVKVVSAKSKLLKPHHVLELLSAGTVTEFISRFTTMQKTLNELVPEQVHNSTDLERTLRDAFFKYMVMLVNHSPEECAGLLIQYLQKYEIENLKTLLASKIVNLDATALRDGLYFQVEAMLHSDKIIRGAMNAQTLEEIIYLYRKTSYHDVLHDVETRYKKTNELFFVYAILDRFYIENLSRYYQAHEHAFKNHAIFERFIGLLIDVYNITMVVRSVNHGFEWREAEILLVPDNAASKVGIKQLHGLHEIGPDPEGMERKIRSIIGSHAWTKPYTSLIIQERIGHSLKSYLYVSLLKACQIPIRNDSSTAESSLARVLSFVIRKEMEIENILTIFKGVQHGFDVNMIKKYLFTDTIN